jgi:hypothetical protein
LSPRNSEPGPLLDTIDVEELEPRFEFTAAAAIECYYLDGGGPCAYCRLDDGSWYEC